jgi:uncharacterized protein (TIGR01777 family)
MKIVISGATGFLGRPLAATLALDGHTVVVLSRGESTPPPGSERLVSWNPDGSAGPWAAEIDGAGAVINLAGESIAGGRWTAARKRRILDSRVLATRSLVEAIGRARTPPAVFVSGSAVGYYGPLQDQVATEDTAPGTDFLAKVCAAWEEEASRAQSARTRVVCVRTGLVLERDGGALPQMLPPFRFGAGGPVGSGRQYWPWIHRQDWIDLVRFALATPAIAGPMNATAPNPVRNAEFARALGRAMRRPAFMPAPGFALKLLLGEMAEGLLLSGQRAVPAKAQRHGYTFAFPSVDDAFEVLFPTSRRVRGD